MKDDGTPIVETQRALSRARKRMRPRLEMLGYTYESCKKRFELWIEDEDVPPPSFRAFEQALKSSPWVQEAPSIDFDDAVRETYARQPASGYPEGHMESMIAWERPLDPYMVLRVLAEDPAFDELPINWNFADVLDGAGSPRTTWPAAAG